MVKSMVRGRDFPLCQLWDHHSCCNNMMFLQARLCITVRILYALTFSFTSLCTVLDYLAKVLRYLHVFWSFECFVFLALTFKHHISAATLVNIIKNGNYSKTCDLFWKSNCCFYCIYQHSGSVKHAQTTCVQFWATAHIYLANLQKVIPHEGTKIG